MPLMRIGNLVVLGALASIAIAAAPGPQAAVPALAQSAPMSRPAAAFQALRDLDRRVHQTFFRLTVANLPLCDRHRRIAGWVLQDVAQFPQGARNAAREVFVFESPVSVELVLPGSPAERAGIRENDGIVSINGKRIDSFTVANSSATGSGGTGYDRMAAVNAAIDAALAEGEATIGYVREGREGVARIAGVAACPYAVQVKPSTEKQAGADGQTITITSRLVDFTRDADEIAGILAHELGHNILEHRRRLDAAGVDAGAVGRMFGKNRRLLRRAEDDADALSVYVMLNAGYDPLATLDYWRRIASFADYGIFSDGTYGSPEHRRERIARIAREASALPLPIIPEMVRRPLPPMR